MKNPRNRNHKEKRVLSQTKFWRIYNNNPESVGVAYRFRKWQVQMAVNAVIFNGFLYCEFDCKDQQHVHYVRYSLNDLHDFIAFHKHPHASF